VAALPDDFAEALARVIDPAQRDDAAEIIDAAALLDDAGLRRFLQMFAARVRASETPVRADELRTFLRRAAV
jgi:hypothetical protein